MKVFDNLNDLLCDDLKETIRRKSRVSAAAESFSIYAFEVLRKQLKDVDEFRFIFTSPTFVREKNEELKREFYIPRQNREKSLYGTEFEIRLRNEMTQRAVARECAEWIRKKARFKSNRTNQSCTSFMTVGNDDGLTAYAPLNGFTPEGLGSERGNAIVNWVNRLDSPHSENYLHLFEQLWNQKETMEDVTQAVIEHISDAYQENAPDFIYFMTLYHVFSEFLKDISEDILPNEATGFKKSAIWNLLYDFQRDAVLSIISKLEKYNGCILADSVGLGKTFSALAVIKYYESRNQRVLVLCPKKLAENWNFYRNNLTNNPISEDRFRYDVFFHTDLGRDSGKSNGKDLEYWNWGNYDLVVIDESHNFRNGIGTHKNTKENRYSRLMDRVIRSGVKTKVLMLSATPVNNQFLDLKNQLALAYEGKTENINDLLNTEKGIDEIFRQAQAAFNAWSKLPSEERTTEALLQKLDFDFFELLDSVTIARSRKHIMRYYDAEAIGRFPIRLKPLTLRPSLTSLSQCPDYNQIYTMIVSLNLHAYTPTSFIHPSKWDEYAAVLDHGKGITQKGREQGIKRLMYNNLLKRLESSVHSFRLTLQRIQSFISKMIQRIDQFEKDRLEFQVTDYEMPGELDFDDKYFADETVGKRLPIRLIDMDWVTWREDLKSDIRTLDILLKSIEPITPQYDEKLDALRKLMAEKIKNPINENNRKMILFSAFADTAEYLYEHISQFMKEEFGLETALITGSKDGTTTVHGIKRDLNTLLTCFSPRSKGGGKDRPEIDILIATDCISEGQNLQDCDWLVNYDIHWNPVRIIQRFGRIDRIGSTNEVIQLVNFWPDVTLDDYIKLKERVEARMKVSVMTSTGDDNPIEPEEKGDLEYRKEQLKRMQDEIIDLEETGTGISILDLGLNEFRMDLIEYVKAHKDIERKPCGLHAVVPADEDLPEGVIFVLKNINDGVNIGSKNRIHPFYMVYVDTNGKVVSGYLQPKKVLDEMRALCRSRSEPIPELYRDFNMETNDGRKMDRFSELLGSAIQSIIHAKEQSDLDSLFQPGGTTALMSEIRGLNDFELISFLVVRK